MRDDPYPARYFGRQTDEPFLSSMLSPRRDSSQATAIPIQQPLPRVFLLLMTLYLCCALLLIFTVTTYAAPLGSATISPHVAEGCVDTATVAAR